MAKLGFCCKWISPIGNEVSEGLMNTRTTTITALSKLSPTAKRDRLIDMVADNMTTLKRVMNWTADLPDEKKMYRISSDLLPAYTHEVTEGVYDEPQMREIMEVGLSEVGKIARDNGIRIMMHPGQFCVLNSTNHTTYLRSVIEFEYHTRMMEMMGYDTGWHPDGAGINIHVGGKDGGLQGFLKGLEGLSSTARNLITVENDEFSYGLDALTELTEEIAIVLDIHHEWIFSGGQYIQPDDTRIQAVKDSWRGVRPVGHLSTSRESFLRGHDVMVKPDFESLRQQGLSLRDIRGHSDDCWNVAVNDWALSHLEWMDIEIEAKNKNLAVNTIYDQYLARRTS